MAQWGKISWRTPLQRDRCFPRIKAKVFGRFSYASCCAVQLGESSRADCLRGDRGFLRYMVSCWDTWLGCYQVPVRVACTRKLASRFARYYNIHLTRIRLWRLALIKTSYKLTCECTWSFELIPKCTCWFSAGLDNFLGNFPSSFAVERGRLPSDIADLSVVGAQLEMSAFRILKLTVICARTAMRLMLPAASWAAKYDWS